jgi:hypothetical protein
MPDSPPFRHKKMYNGGKRNTLQLSMWRQSAGINQNVGPLLLNLLYDTDKSLENAGRPEFGEKIGPASAFLPTFNFVMQSGIGIPESGSVRYRWSRIRPALPSYESYMQV